MNCCCITFYIWWIFFKGLITIWYTIPLLSKELSTTKQKLSLINNNNPLQNKKRNFSNLYNNINIIGNNNSKENNFMKKTKNQNIYNRFSINNYDYAKPIKLLNKFRYKKSTSRIKLLKAKWIYMRINLVQISK